MVLHRGSLKKAKYSITFVITSSLIFSLNYPGPCAHPVGQKRILKIVPDNSIIIRDLVSMEYCHPMYGART